MMELVREHGAAVVALTIDEEGQARTADNKVAIASRLVDRLTGEWGMRVEDIVVDCLTFPIATGQEETRRDAIETIEAIRELKRRYPSVQTTLGVSNVSFGLSPAARIVLNSVFLNECREAGLDAAIAHAARIMPMHKIDDHVREVTLDLVYDRRRDGYDPLERFLDIFSGVDAASMKATRADELAALPLDERLARRIVDGERKGLEEDLQAALDKGRGPLDIINDNLLQGMKTVGELFGRGEMQLPFVLQSAEAMKTAVAFLEPHIEAQLGGGSRRSKARIVLATVKGDVHDIGKNLVDIILSNNGYEVVNIGIKQPISENDADAIGMSGLLVKSTVIMKENLQELNSRGLAARWPVLLGGAALTRAYVEHDLAEVYEGEVRYARDAFDGLRLMDAVALAKTDPEVSLSDALPELRQRRVRQVPQPDDVAAIRDTTRSDVATDNPVPTPPFWGTRVVKGIALADYTAYLDERATFLGQWGLKPSRGSEGPSYEELVETEGRPRLRMWLDRIKTEDLLEAAVVYGYFPCYSEGNDVVVLGYREGERGQSAVGEEVSRFTFPRQRRDRRLCLADFFKSRERYEADGVPDVLPLQLVTMGSKVAQATGQMFADNAYRDYLELHGLSVQLTEALAEMWHARVREELGFGTEDAPQLEEILRQRHRGSRYSFGYPACPDLEDRAKLVALLHPERIGVSLSEELQLHPEQSTDALVVHHPEAKYFNAG
jgi:5-methyltetrahydrofolate--homocysteine methyltransferase